MEDAARAANLSVSMAQALESDDYAALGQPVYARGYYRRYARVVGCQAEDVVGCYEIINEVPSAVPQIQQRPSIPYGAKSSGPGIRMSWLWLFVAAAVLGALWWFWNSPSDESAQAAPIAGGVTSVPSAVPVTTPAPLPDQSAQRRPPTADLSQLKLSDELSLDQPADSARSASDVPGVAAGLLEILVGPQAAWIEVRDARDERLAYRVAQPGEQLRLQGEPPYRINLGRAHTLEVRLGGRLVDLGPVLDSAARARATMTEDGELIAP
jgi:cytoskeleton protein RodZ